MYKKIFVLQIYSPYNTKNMHKYICPLKSPAGFAQ